MPANSVSLKLRIVALSVTIQPLPSRTIRSAGAALPDLESTSSDGQARGCRRKTKKIQYWDKNLEGEVDEQKQALATEIPREIIGFLSQDNDISEFQLSYPTHGNTLTERESWKSVMLALCYLDCRRVPLTSPAIRLLFGSDNESLLFWMHQLPPNIQYT